MDIKNMIKNVITRKIDEIDLEELTEEAITECIDEYVGDFEEVVKREIKQYLERNEEYERMTDEAIEGLISENMN